MDIKFLSEQTGISIRQIRYVLDHQLVPDRTWFVDEFAVGRARTFDEITGTFIACAVYLLGAGYKRDSIRELITAISKPMRKNGNPLRLPIVAEILKSSVHAKVQFADGRFVRWIVRDEAGEWVDSMSRSKGVSNLIPKVTIEIDVGQIRDLVTCGADSV